MIAVVAVLAVVALLLVWLSLSMAATEGAVGRVTRASLNNLILEVQTDAELSQFIRDKKIKRIHKVQRLVADRYATAGSCAFFRICCNVLDGVLVTVIAGMLDAPLWAELLAGFVFAIVVAVISLLVRPRSAGASKPVDIMLQHADTVSIAVLLTPFAKIGGQRARSVVATIFPTTRNSRRSRSSRGARPSTVWLRPTISTPKFPKCYEMYSRFPKH